MADHAARLVTALKVSPASRTKRAENFSLLRVEEQISLNVAKLNALSKPDSPVGTEAKCKATLDLVILVDQKRQILTRGADGLTRVDLDSLSDAADTLLAVIVGMREPLLQNQEFTQLQYALFQSRLNDALAGDDTEYRRVVEVDQVCASLLPLCRRCERTFHESICESNLSTLILLGSCWGAGVTGVHSNPSSLGWIVGFRVYTQPLLGLECHSCDHRFPFV